MKGLNCVLVPASLQGLNDVKAWNLWLELLLMLSWLQCSLVSYLTRGVITFQLNSFSVVKVSRDKSWHICDLVEVCVSGTSRFLKANVL